MKASTQRIDQESHLAHTDDACSLSGRGRRVFTQPTSSWLSSKLSDYAHRDDRAALFQTVQRPSFRPNLPMGVFRADPRIGCPSNGRLRVFRLVGKSRFDTYPCDRTIERRAMKDIKRRLLSYLPHCRCNQCMAICNAAQRCHALQILHDRGL